MLPNSALVPLAPARDDKAVALAASTHAQADFLAHLIATAAQAPQTRARRRAEPEDAVAVYRAVGQWPTESGRALSRSL
jgi:hypothetical protein